MSTLRTNEVAMLDDIGKAVFTFDSVAQMKDSAQISVGQKVRTLGYYAPGDGGGNDYEIVAAGTGTDDGGSFIDLPGSGSQAKGLFTYGTVYLEAFGSRSDESSITALSNASAFAEQSGMDMEYTTPILVGGVWTNCPQNTKLVQKSKSAYLKDISINLRGGYSNKQDLSKEAGAGDVSVSVNDASGFEVGDYIRVVSSLNSGSNDAGELRLGNRVIDYSFLAEYKRVVDIDYASNSLTLDGPLLWEYPLSSFPESGYRSTSSVYKMDFHEGFSMEGVRLKSSYLGAGYMLSFWYTKDTKMSNCFVDTGNFWGAVRMIYALDGALENCHFYQPELPTVPEDAQMNPLRVESATDMRIVNCIVDRGSQGVDISYRPNPIQDEDHLGGGPSMRTVLSGVLVKNTRRQGITDHPGVYATEVNNCKVIDANGMSLRGHSAKVSECIVENAEGTTSWYGIRVHGSATGHTRLENNIIKNADQGIYVGRFDGIGVYENEIFDDFVMSTDVIGNNISSCRRGIVVIGSISSGLESNATKLCPTLIKDNTLRFISDYSIANSRYANGTTIDGNVAFDISGVFIHTDGDCTDLTVVGGTNRVLRTSSGSVLLMTGPADFITDLSLFPEGQPQARLSIGTILHDQMGTPYRFPYFNPDCYVRAAHPSSAKWINPIGSSLSPSGDIERGQIGIFLSNDSSELIAYVRDRDNNLRTITLGAW